jgi:hypothetical protein
MVLINRTMRLSRFSYLRAGVLLISAVAKTFVETTDAPSAD